MKLISAETKLETFVPQYQNQAITFTGDDMAATGPWSLLFCTSSLPLWRLCSALPRPIPC